MDAIDGNAGPEPQTAETFRELRRHLHRILPLGCPNISPADRFELIIPPEERRRVWDDLQAAGYELPRLQRSPGLVLVVMVLVLAPVALLVLSLRDWAIGLCVIELAFVAVRLTRRWAIHPPIGCETVLEALLQLRPFRREDYRAGRWPREEIAAKVRFIVARCAGLPFDAIKDETSLAELFD